MPINRLTVITALAPFLFFSGALQAQTRTVVDTTAIATATAAQLFNQTSAFSPAQALAQSVVPAYAGTASEVAQRRRLASKSNSGLDRTDSVRSAATDSVSDGLGSLGEVRQALIGLAMSLRDIRYVRGGRDPSTGFDCSGFVRYVFAHATGMQLPTNSAEQFLAGLKVRRADMKPGDLVFFHTRGRQRISHVGIYLSEGRFIHSPASGKSVEISSLDEAYWASHFAGAKRPEPMAMLTTNHG